MARIRTIKPEFFRHEELQDLERSHPKLYCMLTFVGLWTLADRDGRFECRPRQMKLDILPFIDFDISKTLAALESSGFIQRYEVGGKSYGVIRSFGKHQRFSGKEANEESKLPPPPEKQPGSNREATGKISETPVSQEGKGREKEREEEGEGIEAADAASPLLPEFEDKSKPTPTEFLAAWTELVPFSPVDSMTEKRQTALRARRSNDDWRRDWRKALAKVRGSPFLRGENDRNWTADVDFFLRPDTVTKILEGKYDERIGKHKGGDGRITADAGTVSKIKYFTQGSPEGAKNPEGADPPSKAT